LLEELQQQKEQKEVPFSKETLKGNKEDNLLELALIQQV
jgi:hypothetical protein